MQGLKVIVALDSVKPKGGKQSTRRDPEATWTDRFQRMGGIEYRMSSSRK